MKVIEIAILFVAVGTILFMGLSMVASIPEPEAGTDEAEIFAGLSKIVDISYSGFWIVLLIIVAMAIIGSIAISKKIL